MKGLVVILLLSFVSYTLADAWPGGVSVTGAIGKGRSLTSCSGTECIPNTYELSGVHYYPKLDILYYISDRGYFVATDYVTGNNMLFNIAPIDPADPTHVFNFEGVTTGPVLSQKDDYVYLLDEELSEIIEIRHGETYINRRLKLEGITVKLSQNKGTEGIAFIPIDNKSGYFVIGNQLDGKIYHFYFDFTSSSTSLHYVSTYLPHPVYTDIADLAWDAKNSLLWVVYDADTLVVALKQDSPTHPFNWFLHTIYPLPVLPAGSNQEGLTIAGQNSENIVVSFDNSGTSASYRRDSTAIWVLPFSR